MTQAPPTVSIVIFNSTVDTIDTRAVYIGAIGHLVPDDELADACTRAFRTVSGGARAFTAAELSGWQRAPSTAGPGAHLERLRRRLRDKDGWAFDDDAFAAAVARVRAELVDGLLATAFDGSMAAERAVAEFSARWTARLVGGVVVTPEPPVPRGVRGASPWRAAPAPCPGRTPRRSRRSPRRSRA